MLATKRSGTGVRQYEYEYAVDSRSHAPLLSLCYILAQPFLPQPCFTLTLTHHLFPSQTALTDDEADVERPRGSRCTVSHQRYSGGSARCCRAWQAVCRHDTSRLHSGFDVVGRRQQLRLRCMLNHLRPGHCHPHPRSSAQRLQRRRPLPPAHAERRVHGRSVRLRQSPVQVRGITHPSTQQKSPRPR